MGRLHYDSHESRILSAASRVSRIREVLGWRFCGTVHGLLSASTSNASESIFYMDPQFGICVIGPCGSRGESVLAVQLHEVRANQRAGSRIWCCPSLSFQA